ncbi:unnamed protein product [Protopolystoma xenopodis]|uniref:Uncharacterized protein n=1 Tax=Protopolystoma xenopodis TaxID=117903 RepID=A0A448XIK7_9PLAT|nr:unnamed protein product [Protopolystoma xenopodis]
MSEWLAVEAIVCQREREANIARTARFTCHRRLMLSPATTTQAAMATKPGNGFTSGHCCATSAPGSTSTSVSASSSSSSSVSLFTSVWPAKLKALSIKGSADEGVGNCSLLKQHSAPMIARSSNAWLLTDRPQHLFSSTLDEAKAPTEVRVCFHHLLVNRKIWHRQLD